MIILDHDKIQVFKTNVLDETKHHFIQIL